MPEKLDDPGKFFVPCAIGKVKFNYALCDLGANVSLMPKLVFDKLGVGELKPTKITLQLTDQSVKHPIGIVEDLPIQIGKYFMPIDFVVVYMEEDTQTPLLLGRPFLNTAKAVIEVHKGKISFQIADETITFRIGRTMQYPADNSPVCKVDYIDELVQEMMHINPGEISEVVEEVNEIDASTQSLEPPTEQKNQEETAQADEQDEQSKTDQDAVETAESFPLPPEIPDEVPKLDLKPLPSSLRYKFLGDNKTYPVIINSALRLQAD